MTTKGLIYLDLYDVLNHNWLDKRHFLYYDNIKYSVSGLESLENFAKSMGLEYHEKFLEQLRLTDHLQKLGLYEQLNLKTLEEQKNNLSEEEMILYNKISSLSYTMILAVKDMLINNKGEDVIIKASKGARISSELRSLADILILQKQVSEENYLPIITIGKCIINKYVPTPQKDVVSIFFKSIPTISEVTPWEQILEFKTDPDSTRKFLEFRNWISEICRKDYSEKDILEKMEYLRNQYKEHMNLHKLKTDVGTFEVILTSTGEVLENIIKLKFGKLAKYFFDITKQNISLLETELSVPGKELAYIEKINTHFKI